MVRVSHIGLIIDMMIKAKTIKLSLLVILIGWLGSYYFHRGWQFHGYELVSHRNDDVHFIKGEVRVIPSTVVDYDWHSGFLVGLRLNVDSLTCDSKHGGRTYKVRVNNDKRFFIIDVYNEFDYEYIDVNRFKEKLIELGISKKVSLNYTSFESSFSELSRSYDYTKDFEACSILE